MWRCAPSVHIQCSTPCEDPCRHALLTRATDSRHITTCAHPRRCADDGESELFGNNFLLVINIIWWVGVTMGPLFGILKVLKMARVSAEVEDAGMDSSKHGVAPAMTVAA